MSAPGTPGLGTPRRPIATPLRSASTPGLWELDSARQSPLGSAGGLRSLAGRDSYGSLHEASETRKWEQRRRLQGEQSSGNILAHAQAWGAPLDGLSSNLRTYDINGKVYGAGKAATPPPTQHEKAHWLCQVSGVTGGFNIVSNAPISKQHPKLGGSWGGSHTGGLSLRGLGHEGRGAAGNMQPQRNVSSLQRPGFTAIRHSPVGSAARHIPLSFS